MIQSRRDFVKALSLAGTGLALAPLTNLVGCKTANTFKTINENFGLQLYTLRDDMPKDPKGVLRQVASMGYKQIEGYEGPQGLFWGMKNTEFRQFLTDLGMNYVSSHCDINKDFERKAEEAGAIGMKYLLSPYVGPQKSLDDYKRIADTFNQRGAICKKHGLKFGYHNHDYSFVPLEGQLPQDVLMQNTDKDLVDYEMDIYWVVTAGQDPIAWLRKYPGRFTLCHVKDRAQNASDKNASTVLGTGSIDFPTILKEAGKQGMKHYIVEQERYDNTTPLEAVRANAAYMKGLKA